MMRARVQVVGALVVLAMVGMAEAMSSCSQTSTNVAVRTFQQAQKVDVVCLKVNDANGAALPRPIPTVEADCAQVPSNTSGAPLPNHLYAVVTQTNRGQLAVVDLTAGAVVDEDQSTPGINFIPVGATPTDVTVTPDGQLTFVSSANPSGMAIYGIPNRLLLGDSTGSSPPPPLRLTDLLSCGLPQPPEAIAIVPKTGGSTEGGTAAPAYFLVALLRPSGSLKARLVTIDASPFLQTANPEAGSLGAASIAAGTLDACPQLGAAVLSDVLPTSWRVGAAWPDGVPYADAGDLSAQEPPPGPAPSCPAPLSGPSLEAGALADAVGSDALDDGGQRETGATGVSSDAAAALPFGLGVTQDPHPKSAALRNDVPFLYVADGALPIIHVFDLRDPANPVELQPLLATSLADATRTVPVGGIAISPATHDYKTYLYAIDSGNGSLMVFDITDPTLLPQTPLVRPHAELNPLAPRDRLTFAAPVAAVAFVRHDWPLAPSGDPLHEFTGLLCNPNPHAYDATKKALDRGVNYRADMASTILPQATVENFPFRLRGVFAFATLSNGNIVAIDVDDWDAPCRRPDPMRLATTASEANTVGITGSLDLPEPAGGSDDLDPYHAPSTFVAGSTSAAVTLEAFFPVSAPHRPRSAFLLLNDPNSGVHIPNVIGSPQLFDFNGAPVSLSGQRVTSPLMLPTALLPGFIDPTYVAPAAEPDPSKRSATAAVTEPTGSPDGQAALAPSPAVRISFDDPTAHQDQDWTVTYEGALPTVSNIKASLASLDGFQTLQFSSPGASLCTRGIEDASIGRMRAMRAVEAMSFAPMALMSTVASLPEWTADYVEITDDLLPSTDPYWSASSAGSDAAPSGDCWAYDSKLVDGAAAGSSPLPKARYDSCVQTFGAPGSNPDLYLARDLPILNAFDDRLVVGRFGWDGPTERTANRSVVGPDPSNVVPLQRARCCFHHQAAFKVRTGGEWVAVGTNGIGLLHHVRAEGSPQSTDGGSGSTGGACVPSCDPHDTLLNARTFEVAWADPANCGAAMMPPAIDRNSPLAMRNPMFSFVMWAGCGPLPAAGDHTLATRDFVWKFQMRSGFTPVTVSLSQGTTTPVSPQSMRFINSLGQLAVVDGQSQGLVLIDLNTLTFAHTPYF